MIDGWRYYLHAAIPTTAPHKAVNSDPLKDGSLWKGLGRETPLFARWTSDWDCPNRTNWWFVIKDEPFDIAALKSKRRYEINKGNRNFEIKQIDAAEYSEQLYAVTVAAYETYPASYKPDINHEDYIESTKKKWNYYKLYGAFSKDNNNLCGFAALYKKDGYLDFTLMKAMPSQEKYGVNAALVNGVLTDNEELLKDGYYICDGERSIQHETAFQDYLEKYFGFRKAYCTLHMEYNPKYRVFIRFADRLRPLLKCFDSVKLIHQMLLVLKMDELAKESVDDNQEKEK